MTTPRKKPKSKQRVGQVARAGDQTLRSYEIGALPIINSILDRMNLEAILRDYLPKETRRMKVPTATTLLVLIRNILVSREPIYGIGEWTARYAPELFGLCKTQVELLQDDRLGRCLDRLFRVITPDLLMAVVRHVVQEFDVSLEELHNDSTTITFHGDYEAAVDNGIQHGLPTLAITWGHNKDHRPDLKQLLYILTVSDDGGVPVYFTSASGNVADDTTHVATWDLLCQLVGSSKFLYVADCKLATTANMQHIDRRGGRFITILPKTRKEDREFRDRMVATENSVGWDELVEQTDEQEEIIDRISGLSETHYSAEEFRLLWYHSTRKAERDAASRDKRLARSIRDLTTLRDKLHSPRTRYRTREKVEKAVADILERHEATNLLKMKIGERLVERYRQARRGRPSKDTPYVKSVATYYDIEWERDVEQCEREEKTDGIFPLITNVNNLDALEILEAYKRQPIIEKRFSQLKTDFMVAPVYLKSVSRIQSLLCVYFFVLLVQTLLERELRLAMETEQVDQLPMYPEGRACRRPTAHRLIDIFACVQRHELTVQRQKQCMTTALTPLQRTLLSLLGIRAADYGRN